MRLTVMLLAGCLASLPMLALSADVDEACLTHAQAKAKWPTSYLYWRTAKRCWYAGVKQVRSKPATWGKQNSLQLPKPNPDPNGNVAHHSGRPLITDPAPGPSIAYPTLMAGGGIDDAAMLEPTQMTHWPLVMDFDTEPPQFIPWQQRVAFN